MIGIYKQLCPNCGGDVSDEELLTKGVCSSCLSIDVSSKEDAYRLLLQSGKARGMLQAINLKMTSEDFNNFFERLVRARPWALQSSWAKRVFMGHSFSIVAPTGMGKTTFGLIMALYLYLKGKKCYILVPSSLLVQHLLEKARYFSDILGIECPAIGYYTGMDPKLAEEILERISKGDFGILITTDRFLYRRFELISKNRYDFIFVDDVDSFLKSPRNIDRVLMVMGFDEKTIEHALKLVESKGKLQEVEVGKYNSSSILVVSGATLRGKRTKRVRLFKMLLGFEPGFRPELVRNITNLYVKPQRGIVEEVIKLLKKHGGGCLLFVPQTEGLEGVLALEEALKAAGISAYAYKRMDPKMLKKFIDGEYQVLIGIASSRSPLARGIDLPETIRYTIFAGVPRREFTIEYGDVRPSLMLAIVKTLLPILDERASQDLSKIIADLSKITPLRAEIANKVKDAMLSGKTLEGFEGYVLDVMKRAWKSLSSYLSGQILQELAERHDIRIRVDGNRYSFIVPDLEGYIQASGRASRLYVGGVSKGVSIVVVDDMKAFSGLSKRLQLISDEEFKEYSEGIADEEFKIVDMDRDLIRRAKLGEIKPTSAIAMTSSLLIVESPTKARLIASFYGRPAKRKIGTLMVYEVATGNMILSVVSCQGHIFDLSTQVGYHGVLTIDGKFVPVYTYIKRCRSCGEQFTDYDICPVCNSKDIISKKEVVDAIRRLAIELDNILIATDPDSEGEKIAYDILCTVSPFNENTKRLEFHEVTRKALMHAFQSPKFVKDSLVEAQVVRRIEDRWVGFELSRKLWDKFGRRTLSAGRVQTPVLGWILNRMEEAKKRKILLKLGLENGINIEVEEPKDVNSIVDKFKSGELYVSVIDAKTYEDLVNPLPPYTTDTMLKDASTYIRLSAPAAMAIAQDLFEAGLITYHRTDSTNVSSVGINIAKQYIEERYPGMFKPRQYAAEGAHECIRPTRPLDRRGLEFYISSGVIRIPIKLSEEHLRLYDMIFRRFIASQMSEARVQYQSFTIKLDGEAREYTRAVNVLDEGFLRINPIVKVYKPIEPGIYKVTSLNVLKVPVAYPPTQGELVSMMKERGIGRPSTYSKMLSVLFERGYAIEKGGRVIGTKLGKLVYEYLSKNFGDFVSEELTRRLEEMMDLVESGKADYQEIISLLYKEILSIASSKV